MATLEEIDEIITEMSIAPDNFVEKNSQKLFTFRELYDTVCDGIRSSGTIDDVMKKFEMARSDYQRSRLALELLEVDKLEIRQKYCEKNEMEAQDLEKDYDCRIINENEANKCLQIMSQSLILTPSANSSALARRYMKRGWASLLMENFKAAKIDAERSLQFRTSPEEVWNSQEILGHYYAKQNEYKAAEDFFQKALIALRSSSSSSEEKARAAGRISLVYKNIKGRKVTKTKKLKSKPEEIPQLPKVAYGNHRSLESATEAVCVLVSEKKGRCLFATKELKAGDVIIVEEPFAASLSYECLESHCSTCFKRLTVTSVPCKSCSSVWFCDEKCCNDCESPHTVECKIHLLLNEDAMSKMATLVFRILIKQTWIKLKAKKDFYTKAVDSQNIHTKGSVKCDAKQKYSSSDFEAILNLVTNDDKRTFGDMFKRCLTGVFLAFCLKKIGYFGEEASDENIIYITSVALRLLQGVSCNAYGITEYLSGHRGPSQAELLEIGGAVYPTISLTNHSCWPNASRYSLGITCILRATRNIPKGCEVLDNYGQHFISTNQIERREQLKSQYKFDCDCEACANDWPIYPHNPMVPLTLLCPESSCRHQVPFTNDTKQQCPICGEKKRFLTLHKQTSNKLTEFTRSLNMIKQGYSEKALKSLLEHQRFLDQHAVPPGKVCSDSQEAIRQCYTSMGNSYFIMQNS